jgi:hypothetical protein
MEALPAGSATATPRVAPGPYERFLTEFAVRAPTTGLFFARLGKFFSRWLLTRQDWLSDAALEALRETAGRLLDTSDRTPPVAGDPRCLLQGPNRPERELIFGQLFNSILNFSLTTPAGWMAVNDFFVTNHPAGDNASGASVTGVGIVLRLRPQDPAVVACDAVVHGEGWPTTLPVLRIQLGSHGRMYPYSLLEEMLLAEIALSVRVRGLGNVLMQNNLGPLDPSKPFTASLARTRSRARTSPTSRSTSNGRDCPRAKGVSARTTRATTLTCATAASPHTPASFATASGTWQGHPGACACSTPPMPQGVCARTRAGYSARRPCGPRGGRTTPPRTSSLAHATGSTASS